MNLGQTSSDSSATDTAIANVIGSDFTSQNLSVADILGMQPASDAGLTPSEQTVATQLFPTSSQDVTTPIPLSSQPGPTNDASVLNSLVTFGGQVYQYVQQMDAQGNPVYVPQPVSSAAGLLSNPYVLLGGAALLFLLLS